MRRWFRLKMRKIFLPPKNLERAALIRRRMAFCYLFIAWNSLGYLVYTHLKQEYPMSENEKKLPALWYLRLIGEDNVNVITIDGFTKKSHVHYDATTETSTPVDSDAIIKSMYETEETSSLDG